MTASPTPQIGELDIHLFAQGNHHRIYDKLGSHPTVSGGTAGVNFAVWAPNARSVAVVGDFNQWRDRAHPMHCIGGGIWQSFVPEAEVGTRYKYAIQPPQGEPFHKTDPYGFQHEVRPGNAAIVTDLDGYTWHDGEWLAQRRCQDPQALPLSIYEVHLGSWLHAPTAEPPAEGDPVRVSQRPEQRFLTYRELADALVPYLQAQGFTHIELMPVAEHPYDGSWGYQITGFYAPTSRYGTPQDLMAFVDRCHQGGIGVILDWVPVHFSPDAHGLARFDGTPLYEYADPRQGEYAQWGTLAFDCARPQVRNFLIANALFWFHKFHIDGIRADAVAAMLYRDYDRAPGEWIPNAAGGNENWEAVSLLRQLNTGIFDSYPGALAIAEESTTWPQVSQPVESGGLGFNFKWNMGWMHDVLNYFSTPPERRPECHHWLTFPLTYAFSENFVLALSHDEVVHGKRHLLTKMPGDEWQRLANLRALYALLFAYPGKKMLFMGMEFGQRSEWNAWAELDWELLQDARHAQLRQCVRDLNALYRNEPALHSQDCHPAGFEWLACQDAANSVVAFLRHARAGGDRIVVACNFSLHPQPRYAIGVPQPGYYRELLDTDAVDYGGSGWGNLGGCWAQPHACGGWPYTLELTLPPLGVVMLKPLGA